MTYLVFNYQYYTVSNSLPSWFHLKFTKTFSLQVASISSLSTFHNDAVLWYSMRPIHYYLLALRYLPQLSTLLWSPWSKIPRLYPTCMKKSLSRLPLPYLPPVIKIYHFFCCHHCMVTLLEHLSLSPSLVWKDIAQWWS